MLWPTQPLIQAEGSAPNNASVVLQVQTRGVTLLLAGDIEPPAQQALLASGVDLASDVLKVPHHGSRYQDPGFWAAVHPRVAVVSVGEGNTYGHPDPGLLAALEGGGDSWWDVRIKTGRWRWWSRTANCGWSVSRDAATWSLGDLPVDPLRRRPCVVDITGKLACTRCGTPMISLSRNSSQRTTNSSN